MLCVGGCFKKCEGEMLLALDLIHTDVLGTATLLLMSWQSSQRCAYCVVKNELIVGFLDVALRLPRVPSSVPTQIERG